MVPAAIAVFAFRRPHHLRKCLDALAANDEASESDVRVFVDGPRNESDKRAVADVVEAAMSATGFRTISISQAEHNLGLAKSLTSGISQVLETEERVIVVEDDILTSKYFLSFMNDNLDAYAEEDRVASVHAYTYPHPRNKLPSTFFVKGADCWGWGTWRRAWAYFNPDSGYLLREIRKKGLMDDFTFSSTAPFDDMLIDRIAGRNDSWAICWYASALLADMLTLYPDQPMAINIGEDGTGTHGGSNTSYMQEVANTKIVPLRREVVENPEARRCFEDYFRTRYRLPSSYMGRLSWRYIRRLKHYFLS